MNYPAKNRTGWLGAALIAVAVSLGIWLHFAPAWRPREYAMNIWLASHSNSVIDATVRAVSAIFSPANGGIAVLSLLIALAIGRTRRQARPAVKFIVLSICGWAGTAILKWLFSVPRPERAGLCPRYVSGQCYWIMNARSVDSFPSGHATAATTLVMATLLVAFTPGLCRRVSAVMGSMIVALVALTRIYAGVHYPSDTVAGVLVGAGAVLGAAWIWDKMEARRLTTKQTHPAQSST